MLQLRPWLARALIAILLVVPASVPESAPPRAAHETQRQDVIIKKRILPGPTYWFGLQSGRQVRVTWIEYFSYGIGDYYP